LYGLWSGVLAQVDEQIENEERDRLCRLLNRELLAINEDIRYFSLLSDKMVQYLFFIGRIKALEFFALYIHLWTLKKTYITQHDSSNIHHSYASSEDTQKQFYFASSMWLGCTGYWVERPASHCHSQIMYGSKIWIWCH